jgi:hypothetical protein
VNSSWSSPKPVPVGLPVDGFKTGGFTTLVGGFCFAASAFAFAAASAFAFAAVAAVAAAALSFDAEVLIDFFSAATCAGVLETLGLDVNLSINNFVPAPIAAPVSAFVIPLEVELDGLLVDVRVCLGTPVVLVVIDGLVPDVELLVIDGLDVVPKLVVNEGLEPPVDVMALELPPLTFGALLAPLTTLLSGARVSAFASGICLLDVRFLRIAIFYPLFFTSDVKVAISVIGLSFAPLAKVFDGATRVVGADF